MTCKDCIHYEVCCDEYELAHAENCNDFKDKSKYIELPCNVGDTAYFIWNFNEPEIQQCEVKEFQLDCSGIYVCLSYVNCIGHHEYSRFLMRNLHNSWFLTKSEAEAKLKELLNDN